MRRGGYKQVPREWSQDAIHKMIQAVYHLKYYLPRRDRQEPFEITYNDVTIMFYPNGIDYGIGQGPNGYLNQIKWENITHGDALVPTVSNLTPLIETVRNGLGPLLRHWLDTTE
ncbi:hypothetical protein ST201phi2-1p329 [Pseudomonas phage 201phi2-1]|uniref:Uncharacterized protein n=1 Tax=Pseudomonas phage 201phi2-1 TaxID=198110 RepID=B3FJI9_BP201|nr:hypothetical protein ST201phi2-1p329 [Pseudomonas phage 201phi2-1]ABY63154.1 hypothetical protein 201phi2-1p329 [Pseudomonas phage 201phi2-1]